MLARDCSLCLRGRERDVLCARGMLVDYVLNPCQSYKNPEQIRIPFTMEGVECMKKQRKCHIRGPILRFALALRRRHIVFLLAAALSRGVDILALIAIDRSWVPLSVVHIIARLRVLGERVWR
jgi:hypothetical protein